MKKPLPAYRGSDPYVFVSYSHADEDAVFAEIRWLQEKGISVWYDTTGIGAGSEWNDEIAKAIKGAGRFLYFMTPNSVASEHCRRELNFAQSEGRQILVCHLQETKVPDGLRLSLDNRQAILKHRLSAEEYKHALISALPSGAVETNHNHTPTPKGSKWLSRVGAATGAVLIVGIVLWYAGLLSEELPDSPVDRGEIAIAVLPFTNMSNDPEQEFLSDGLAEDILNELATSSSLIVRPRSSSFALKGMSVDLQTIAARLNVAYVLEGSVRRIGDRVRVTAQLSDVANDRSAWSDQYDHEFRDIFALQDTVVGEIASALKVKFEVRKGSEYTPEPEAYEAFLLGRDYFNRYQYNQAAEWYEQATELDPFYADAWAARADIVSWLMAGGVVPNSGEYRAARRKYLERALRIDPAHPGALAGRALMDTFYVERNYEDGVNQLIKLITLYPNFEGAYFPLLYTLQAIGRFDLVERVAVRLKDLSPESMVAQLFSLGRV